jgi:nucleotide-binding universal stress UspA family protein
MYSSLLVPLDRSAFAEQALPWALGIARRAKARLNLVEVHALYALDDPHAAWTAFEPSVDDAYKQAEELYLNATAKWLMAMAPVTVTAGMPAGLAVDQEAVADSILEHVQTAKTDLIVMTTHGRGTVGRFMLGSVADQLIRRAGVPVLVVRPSDKAPEIIPEPLLDEMLIPLDGSPYAEQILEPAMALARLMEARCNLLRIVESRSSSARLAADGSTEKEQAETYLERIAARLREQDLPVQARVLVASHAAEAILKEAEEKACNLIAVTTGGRRGLNRLLRGSVADKLVQAAHIPVLVYRPLGKNS